MRTLLITGAIRGIRLQHARSFAARGIHVFTAIGDTPNNLLSAEAVAMGGSSAPATVEESLADSGHFFNYDGKQLPW